MDGKSNISGLNRQASSFDTMPDAPAAKARKTGATSAAAQAVAVPPSANEASKPSSSIFAEASKELCQSLPKPGWSAENPVTVMKNKKEFTLLAQKMLSQFEASNPNDKTLEKIYHLTLQHGFKGKLISAEFLSRDFNLPPTALNANEILQPLTYISDSNSDSDSDGDSESEGGYGEGLVYNVDGNPVGIAWCLILQPDNPQASDASQKKGEYYINRLVADPWTRGAGTTVIEAAVNRSEELGFSGKVGLFPANKEVQVHYERLGFALKENDNELEVDPATSDKWSKSDDGQYYYSFSASDAKDPDGVKPSYFTSLNALKM